MLRNSRKQSGSAHVAIVIILIVALLGALGFIFWQNFANKEAANVTTEDTTTQTEPSVDEADKEVVLNSGTFNGETGAFQARGYVYTEDVAEPYCETNCATYKRAFFRISGSPNQAIDTFVGGMKGNAFVADSAVALGCVVDGTIQAIGVPMGTPSGDKAYSKEVSDSLIASSATKTIAIEIGRSQVPSGSDAPVCYSHFDSISLL